MAPFDEQTNTLARLHTMSNTNLAVNDATQPIATNPKHVDERFERLERQLTAHGHILESRQPGLPVAGIHRKLALPIPLASYSIGVTCWILGMILLHVRALVISRPLGFS